MHSVLYIHARIITEPLRRSGLPPSGVSSTPLIASRLPSDMPMHTSPMHTYSDKGLQFRPSMYLEILLTNPFHPTGPFLSLELNLDLLNNAFLYFKLLLCLFFCVDQEVNFMWQSCLGPQSESVAVYYNCINMIATHLVIIIHPCYLAPLKFYTFTLGGGGTASVQSSCSTQNGRPGTACFNYRIISFYTGPQKPVLNTLHAVPNLPFSFLN